MTAFGLAVEVGDWSRFTGSNIGAFLGLVPTEHCSGGSRSQDSITKTGNTHARRLLVETAWHHKRPYRTPSKALRVRWESAPAAARAVGTPVASGCTNVGRPSRCAGAAGRRERRGRPGTHRLVLVLGHPGRHSGGAARDLNVDPP